MPDIIRCPTCKRETYRGMVDCPHCGSDMPSHLLPAGNPSANENGPKRLGVGERVAVLLAFIAIGVLLKLMLLP